jgi:hypothetical protein
VVGGIASISEEEGRENFVVGVAGIVETAEEKRSLVAVGKIEVELGCRVGVEVGVGVGGMVWTADEGGLFWFSS